MQPTMKHEPCELARLLSIAEVADALGVDVRHVRRLVYERRIPYIKWGHLLRFDPADITAWIDAYGPLHDSPAGTISGGGRSAAYGACVSRARGFLPISSQSGWKMAVNPGYPRECSPQSDAP